MKTFKALTQKNLTVLLAIIFLTEINAVISQQEDELRKNKGWVLGNNITNIEPLMMVVVGDIEATAISSTSKPYNHMADISPNPNENNDMNNNDKKHANDNDNNITPQAYKYYSNQQEKHKTLNQLQHKNHKNFQHAGQQLSGHNTKQHRHHHHHHHQEHHQHHPQHQNSYRYPVNHYSSKYPFEKHKHHVKHQHHHQQPEEEQQENQQHNHYQQHSSHSKKQIKHKQKQNPSLSSYDNNKQLSIATEMLKQPTIENYGKEKLTTSTYAEQRNTYIDDFVNVPPEDFNYQNDDDFEMLWQNDNEREPLNRNENEKHYSITTPATKHHNIITNKQATMLTPYYDGDDATSLSFPFVDDTSISTTPNTPYLFASDAQTYADDFFFDNDNKFPYLTHLYHQPHHTHSQGQGAQMGDYFAASPRSGRHRGRATSHIIASHNLLHSVGSKKFRSLPETDQEYQMQRLLYAPPTQRHWPVKREAVVEGDVILGGLMMVHSREDTITCGPIMPQGGIQALEAMLYTIDRINEMDLLPNITLGAHILDDCDKDSYGLEMAVDFIKGKWVGVVTGAGWEAAVWEVYVLLLSFKRI
ncbi:hypothetical protein FF38_08737 [Lucilia cuprina]|uniref:Receptor ligand binding region domain-containing protein n=1 Tax=Lucilia cuprina TaxID=7375 RepID=A0A0L0CMZ5_LUCCU|nr:hypothetical protein FF38_08737 [Lucilia cuprina]